MTNTYQDDHYKSTLNLVQKFVDSNQRKRINLLSHYNIKPYYNFIENGI